VVVDVSVSIGMISDPAAKVAGVDAGAPLALASPTSAKAIATSVATATGKCFDRRVLSFVVSSSRWLLNIRNRSYLAQHRTVVRWDVAFAAPVAERSTDRQELPWTRSAGSESAETSLAK
jgi:hypothetical protein